jgi:hypothetical protein
MRKTYKNKNEKYIVTPYIRASVFEKNWIMGVGCEKW